MTTNLDLLSESLTNYVVRPLNAFGFGGFVFDNEGETSVTLTADITDHYLEDNSAIQDHIALRPKKLTLKGYVGELVYRDDDTEESFAQSVTQKLTVASQYLPNLSDGAGQAQSIARGVLSDGLSLEDVRIDSINRITDYYAFAQNNLTPTTKQEQAYRYFKALYEGRFLVSVQTPFEFMNRMAIESITAKQDGASQYVSDFTITLKEIRTVSILNADQNDARYVISEQTPEDTKQGRNKWQDVTVTQVGNMDGLLTTAQQAQRAAARARNLGRLNQPASNIGQ